MAPSHNGWRESRGSPESRAWGFEAALNAEMHFMQKSVLLRPLPPFDLPMGQRPSAQDVIELYKTYSEMPSDIAGKDFTEKGHFQVSFEAWFEKQKQTETVAWSKALRTCTLPSLSNTVEVKERLLHLTFKAESAEQAMVPRSLAVSQGETPTVEEYCSIRNLAFASNFDGVAAASTTEPQRTIDVDKAVPERPLGYDPRGGCGEDAPGDDRTDRMRLGVASLEADTKHAHRFDDELLERILAFEARDGFTPFSRELMSSCLLEGGG